MSRNEYLDDMWVLIKDAGPLVVEITSEEDASLLGSYWNAVQKYLDNGDEEALIEFRGETVGDGSFELESNPSEIEYWARTGELDFKDIYASTTNG